MTRRPRALIIVENKTMPVDRRAWQGALALRDDGYEVSVICPKSADHRKSYELLDGVHVFRHPQPVEADGALGYLVEYSSALFWEFVLSIRVAMKVGFDTVQGNNPPDLIFLVAAFWKYLFGKPYIFDHQDVSPELYEAKFGKRGFFYRLMLLFERTTFAVADATIATNETFRDIAIERGGMDPDRVFVVHSVPDLKKFQRTKPNAHLRNGRRHVVGYVGIMGAQDGVDLLVNAMDDIVHTQGREDVQCVIVGSGTELASLKTQVAEQGLKDFVTFTGFLSGDKLFSALSTFDVGVIPDPKNSYNDKIAMNKIFEYTSLGIPFVQFDLNQARRLVGDAALYAEDNCPKALARETLRLVDDPELRRVLSVRGEARAATLLDWDREKAQLLAAYGCATAGRRRVPTGGAADASASLSARGA